jgi:polyisoprenoid-binding protein YceI
MTSTSSLRFLKPSLLALAAAAFTLSAQAAPLKVDAAKSTVTATFKQMNVPVDAKFKKFNATIDFDAAKPEQGKATVEIDVSASTWAMPSTTRKCKEGMVQRRPIPKATFVSSSIKAAGAGKLTWPAS